MTSGLNFYLHNCRWGQAVPKGRWAGSKGWSQPRRCPHWPGLGSAAHEHSRQRQVLETGSIHSPGQGKVINQAQGPSRESSQE